jgi:hypothetical protein
MSARSPLLLTCCGILVIVLLFSGCMTIDIGDTGYTNESISLTITNAGEPSEGYVQVTVYEIKNNLQEETDVFFAPLALPRGENTAFVPGKLKPGRYKLYIYLIQNGERKAATIRDIVVN